MARKKNDEPQEAFEDIDDEIEVVGDDSVELSEAEKLELEKEARTEVMKALKASKAKAFKAQAKKRLQAEMLFRNGKDDSGEDLVTVALHLASHPKYIMLDGAVYHSNRKYTVRRAVATVLLDQMHRGWEQEEARLSPEAKGNLKQHRNFILRRQAGGEYGLQQLS